MIEWRGSWRRWLPLFCYGLLGPFLFFVVPIFYAAWMSAFGALAAETALEVVASDIPSILLGVEIVLGVVALVALTRSPDVVLLLRSRAARSADLKLGLGAGLKLGLLYLFAIAPANQWLQATFGDYVTPGEAKLALGGQLVVFAIANVLLAPFVEEVLYRGVLFEKFAALSSLRAAIVGNSVLFALLHWGGGFWYMAIAGVLGGGVFTWLRHRTDRLVAPIAAHFMVNLVETMSFVF